MKACVLAHALLEMVAAVLAMLGLSDSITARASPVLVGLASVAVLLLIAQFGLASARPATPSARASPLALNKQTRDTEKEVVGMEEYSNINRLYWLQLILYHHAFLTQAATLSCSTSSRRPPRASPAARSPAAPGMHPGRTYACRSAPVPAAAPPRLLRKPRVY